MAEEKIRINEYFLRQYNIDLKATPAKWAEVFERMSQLELQVKTLKARCDKLEKEIYARANGADLSNL